MDFKRLTAAEKPLFDSYITARDVEWEYNIATLLLWDVNDTMMYALDGGDMYIYNVFGGRTVFMPPYLGKSGDFLASIKKISRHCADNGMTYAVCGLNREQAQLLAQNGYTATTDRNDYDYVYRADDLKYLHGKAYHSKRNFVTRFCSGYDYLFREYEEGDFEGLMALYDTWQVDSSHATLALERRAIERAFRLRRELDLKIMLILVDGKYAAFSVSSTAHNGVNHCIFEKAETEYVGIYQAINKFTAERNFADGTLVNRQEDMGIEGLRKAKLSYPPAMLIEKYWAEEKR